MTFYFYSFQNLRYINSHPMKRRKKETNVLLKVNSYHFCHLGNNMFPLLVAANINVTTH